MPDHPPDQIIDRITASPRWRRVEYEPVVGSTNTIVAERATQGAASGLVVAADHQTAGRGRLDRSWVDQPGGSLAVTALVARPPRSTLVPLAAGMAVSDAAAEQGVHTALKWPNDVLTGDERKCAGVLVETVAEEQLAIGIGVNVDWRHRTGEVDPSWGSLAEEVDADVDRWRLLADLLHALDEHLGRIEGEPDRFLDVYRSRCLTLGRDVSVELSDGVLDGTVVDVSDDGALLVQTGERTVPVRAGDVHHVRPA